MTRTDNDYAEGDASGIAFPTHIGALQAAGPAFLTEAFRQSGVLGEGNAVAAILEATPCSAGNSGSKALLSVEYVRRDPRLHSALFVKFSRDFEDAFRDRRKCELLAEVRLAELSRHPNFPVSVPSAYFGDFHAKSGSGILIAQRIPFGSGGIEPIREKCMDFELARPEEYYAATISALAQLAGAVSAGRLSPQVETLFPLDADAAALEFPIAFDQDGLSARVMHLRDFVQLCPHLFPPSVRAGAFLCQFEAEAAFCLRYEQRLRSFLHADPDWIALCHWNSNLDNAWFWRDQAGRVQCGLLDWGMVRRMNVAYGLWGGLSAAEPSMLEKHLDALLGVFLRELEAHGGPALCPNQLGMHFDASVALLGLALMMDVPALVLSRLPEARLATNVRDPILRRDEVARCFLHVFTNFLVLWSARDIGASLRAIVEREEA